MASQFPLRPLVGSARSAVRRSARPSPSSASAFVSATASSPSSSSAATVRPYVAPARVHEPKPAPALVDVPRWKQTPRAMTAPVRIRPITPGNEWEVNEDPRKLEEAYTRMLGNYAETFLSEEIKWLAVTHKSFDHGRRGFNDRLAYLGKRITELQTSLVLLSMPQGPTGGHKSDPHGRAPFQHPKLDGISNVSGESKNEVLSKSRLADLAREYGFESVMRWKPKRADDLQGSGIDVVLAHTLYAIIGALAMQKGGEVANKTVRNRILAPLGIFRP